MATSDFFGGAHDGALDTRIGHAQRQRLPSMCAMISALVGSVFLASSEAACMICPDWQ